MLLPRGRLPAPPLASVVCLASSVASAGGEEPFAVKALIRGAKGIRHVQSQCIGYYTVWIPVRHPSYRLCDQLEVFARHLDLPGHQNTLALAMPPDAHLPLPMQYSTNSHSMTPMTPLATQASKPTMLMIAIAHSSFRMFDASANALKSTLGHFPAHHSHATRIKPFGYVRSAKSL
jgi:hypothetical protein